MGDTTNLKRSLVMAILLSGMLNIGRADVIYVKAGASGAGTSWADATGDLPGALVSAAEGDEIWVAEGTYKPGASKTDSFQMKNGVAIYGGFAASGNPGWPDRDPNIYETILNGDLNDDDLPGFENLGTLLDNCTHVFYHPSGLGLDGTAILDGVTISGGLSMGTGESANGAGMYNHTASPAVTGCRFSNNFALGDMDTIPGKGGGMYNENSQPAVTNCDFTANTSWNSGGGMYNNNSDPCVIDCRFTANIVLGMGTGNEGGAGMVIMGSNPTVTVCTFVDNQAANPDSYKVPAGGGMLIKSSSSPTVTECVFSGNSAETGGGMQIESSSSPTVTDCVFTGNSAATGGGMVIGSGCSPTITDCVFTANQVHGETLPIGGIPANGGGMINSGTPTMTGCEFSSNTAEDDGGGLHSSAAGWTLNRCTFLNNSAGNKGGGIFLWNSTTVTNCILAYNSASHRGGGIYIESYLAATVTNCTFYNNTAGDEGGGIFVGNYATPTVNNSILWEDMPDEVGKTVLATVTVSYCDIQDTSYAGSGGNFVSDPLFIDAINDNFHLKTESPCINAGNNSAPGIPAEDIDGNYRIMYGRVEIGADEIAPVYVNASASGKNDGSKWPDAFTDFQDAVDSAPGGVDIWVAAGTYKTGNQRTDSFSLKGGEVIYGGFPASGDSNWDDRDARVYKTILSGDIGVEGAAADNCYHVLQNEGRAGQSVSYLDGFIITGGNADGDDEFSRGGGIYNFFFDLYLTNCRLLDNSAEIGGGICSLGSFVSLINCLLSGNTAIDGGGMYNFLSFTDLINCTISGNAAGVGGGALNGGYSEMSATNCIFWSNNIYNREIYNGPDSIAMVSYSDVQGGYNGTGNINSDPCFVNPNGGDFRLQPDSPCIETGDNAATDLPTIDLDGHPRIADGDCNDIDVVDMGAYEFNWHGAGDFDNDCFINFFDFSISARYWMTDDSFVDIAPPGGDGIVDFQEVAIIADNWLAGTVP